MIVVVDVVVAVVIAVAVVVVVAVVVAVVVVAVVVVVVVCVWNQPVDRRLLKLDQYETDVAVVDVTMAAFDWPR